MLKLLPCIFKCGPHQIDRLGVKKLVFRAHYALPTDTIRPFAHSCDEKKCFVCRLPYIGTIIMLRARLCGLWQCLCIGPAWATEGARPRAYIRHRVLAPPPLRENVNSRFNALIRAIVPPNHKQFGSAGPARSEASF